MKKKAHHGHNGDNVNTLKGSCVESFAPSFPIRFKKEYHCTLLKCRMFLKSH